MFTVSGENTVKCSQGFLEKPRVLAMSIHYLKKSTILEPKVFFLSGKILLLYSEFFTVSVKMPKI